MPGVFLSHSSKDKSFATRLAIDLTSKGFPVWLDTWEMTLGDSLLERIYDGIDRSSFLIVIISAASLESKWVQKEVKAAIIKEDRGEGPFVVPLKLDPVDLPLIIADRIYADFSSSYNTGFEQLATFLEKRGARHLAIPEGKRIFPDRKSVV